MEVKIKKFVHERYMGLDYVKRGWMDLLVIQKKRKIVFQNMDKMLSFS